MPSNRRIFLAIAVVITPLTWNFGVVPSAGEAASVPARQRGHYYIDLRFTGLMVFTPVPGQLTRQGKMKVSFHSKADYHNVTIAIVDGPSDLAMDRRITYPLFLVRDAKAGGDWTLNAPGYARWAGKVTPFSMKSLHTTAVEEVGELQPSLTLDAGDFEAKEPMSVLFKNDNEVTKGPYSCPTVIVARIRLKMSEAAIFGGPFGTFEFPKPKKRNEVFKVQISNIPDLRYIEKHHHFIYYYDGARVIKNGKREKVDPADQFEAVRPIWQVIETRPCIPITY